LTSLPVIRLKPRRALPFFSQHPWVYSTAIAQEPPNLEPGTEVALAAHDRQFIARGLYNPHSQIRVRLYSWEPEVAVDEALIDQRIATAVSMRNRLFPNERACRLFYSEADGLSGLTVDRYDDFLLVQLTSLALASHREAIYASLAKHTAAKGIWLRTEKGTRKAESLDLPDGLAWGEAPPEELFIEQAGVKYSLNVATGQKTGFFIDQRDNRLAVARLAHGKRVLDICCYSGGFGLTCLVAGGASHVTAVDSSASAIELTQKNAALNSVADHMTFVVGDAFKVLENLRDQHAQFDVIILDPPKLARNRASLEAALKGYYSLNQLALGLLPSGGLLATCSCSGLVTAEMFESMLTDVALSAYRPLQILEKRGPAPDHPQSVFCPETNYLKCYLCYVG
jgi:23S rRNA (cytosine1962-C5)-methyltransferase